MTYPKKEGRSSQRTDYRICINLTQSNAQICEVLVFSNILLEIMLGHPVPDFYSTETFHIRQMTDTLPKTSKGAYYHVAVTLRQLQGKHPKCITRRLQQK